MRRALLLCIGVLAWSSHLAQLVVAADIGVAERLFQNALPLANMSLQGRFISQMADGTLPEHVFNFYLRQDNLYLGKYARAFAAIASRAGSTDELSWLVTQAGGYLREHGNTTEEDMGEDAFERSALPTTIAYTSFFLQAALGSDPALAYAAVLPCQRLYDWLFATLNATRDIASDNPYKDFIAQYADPANHATSAAAEALLDKRVGGKLSDELARRMQFVYNTAMRYEADFFEQSFSAPPVGGAGAVRASAPRPRSVGRFGRGLGGVDFSVLAPERLVFM